MSNEYSILQITYWKKGIRSIKIQNINIQDFFNLLFKINSSKFNITFYMRYLIFEAILFMFNCLASFCWISNKNRNRLSFNLNFVTIKKCLLILNQKSKESD